MISPKRNSTYSSHIFLKLGTSLGNERLHRGLHLMCQAQIAKPVWFAFLNTLNPNLKNMHYIYLAILLHASALSSWTQAPEELPSMEIIQEFWHGRSFTNHSTDGLGSSTNTFQFSNDGKSGEFTTSGNVGNSQYQGRNKFFVVSSTPEKLTIEYTWTSDPSMAQYIVGTQDRLLLNAQDLSLTSGNKVYR